MKNIIALLIHNLADELIECAFLIEYQNFARFKQYILQALLPRAE
jgi:hypothetical protein